MVDEKYNPMTEPRYCGIPTFMRTELTKDFEALDIALIGIPYDGAVEARSGTRQGPRQIRDMSTMMRAIHHVTRINPYELCRVADVGDIRFRQIFDVEASHADITEFIKKLHHSGVTPISAGGDHSITLPIMRAIAQDGPLGMVHIDAHTDCCDTEMNSKYSHGTPFRRAVEEGLLDPKRTIQIGIRGAANSDECWEFGAKHGIRIVYIEEFTKLGVEEVIKEARRVVGDLPTYISFDVDGIDPAFAPGTGTPEIGGLTPIEGQALIRGLRGLNLIGGDVVEVSPPFDPSGNTALLAATMMYEMLCIIAEAKHSRK
ncbi:MAG: agmatinase [SAR324 cluster bacterium]|uniref:Agmatinase n=1 Tax=SAR324 cluster bacterium TaxID=2024889 RepID=A0A2A4SW40_9DELT|nr:MAG: agmatinase [SAR324 cluster bacterium]